MRIKTSALDVTCIASRLRSWWVPKQKPGARLGWPGLGAAQTNEVACELAVRPTLGVVGAATTTHRTAQRRGVHVDAEPRATHGACQPAFTRTRFDAHKDTSDGFSFSLPYEPSALSSGAPQAQRPCLQQPWVRRSCPSQPRVAVRAQAGPSLARMTRSLRMTRGARLRTKKTREE